MTPLNAIKQATEQRRISCPVVRGLRDNARHYWGDAGDFAYACFDWANDALFDGTIASPLIQFALTPYGRCLGLTSDAQEDWLHPIITLHPTMTWGEKGDPRNPRRVKATRRGKLHTLDVIIHEMLHCYIGLMKQGGDQTPMHTSHDNALWADAVTRLSPIIGLPGVVAAKTKRKRLNGKMIRFMTGAIDMKTSATWPGALRSSNYYTSADVPFDWLPCDDRVTS